MPMWMGLGLALRPKSGPVAAFATGVLSFNGNAADTETITIGATVYRFVVVLAAPYDVLIGASASITINNLIAAINAGAGEGTVYGTGTAVHPDVTASAVPGKMNATAKVAGVAGNSIVTQSSAPNATWGAATLQGGLGGASLPQYASIVGFGDSVTAGQL